MNRIDAMRAFATAVDRGSLASTARSPGRCPATATRVIALLEGKLGTRLPRRSTRAPRPTEFGGSYSATCRDVLSALDFEKAGSWAAAQQPRNMTQAGLSLI